MTVSTAPGRVGRTDRSCWSTLSCSAWLLTRTSISRNAAAGTVLVVVPTAATVGVTVVPVSGTPISATARIRCDNSTPALIPFSGSMPAWAARPVISNR